MFVTVGDPVALDFIKSFAHPGGNVTGVTDLEFQLGPKRLQVFQEMVPGLKRVLFPYFANSEYESRKVGVYRDAARRLGIDLIEKALLTQTEAKKTLSAVRKNEVDGFLAPYSFALNIFGLIMEAEAQQGIPTMYSGSFFPELTGLASYGPNQRETGRLAARLVDKILKGANPAAIPIEVNNTIEFVINLKTAKALGLTILPEVLYQADRIIR